MTQRQHSTGATTHAPQLKPIPRRDSLGNLLRATSQRSLLAALGIFLFGMAFTLITALGVKASAEETAQKEFDFINNEIHLNIESRLEQSAQILRSGAAMFEGSPDVTRQGWQAFVSELEIEKNLPGIQGVGFSLLIPREQLQQHTEAIRAEGFAEYSVRPAGERDVYSSIIYLEPFTDRNLRAFGFDMFQEPVRNAAMARARDEHSLALSGKVLLVQETDEDVQAGTLMYIPVYKKGMPLESVEQRRAAILGWVYSPYRMKDYLNGTLRSWQQNRQDWQITLQVYDGESISPDALLYDSSAGQPAPSANGTPLIRQTLIEFGGARWMMVVNLAGGLTAAADYGDFWRILLGGSLISALAFWLILAILSARANARRMAEVLTVDLRESEEKYRIVFENEIYAICIFDLQTFELLEVNTAYERTYGYSRAELLGGMTIHDITAQHQESDVATQQAVRNGTTFIPLRLHRKKDGTVFPVEIVGGPYEWRDRKVMFAMAHDITERRRAEKDLVESEARFRTIIDVSPVPMALNDDGGNVTFVNAAFVQAYGYEQQDIPTISAWWQLAYPDPAYRHWVAATWQENIERARLNGDAFTPMEVTVRCKDGASKTVLANAASIGGAFEGNHLVVLYDITERIRAEERIHELAAELQVTLNTVTAGISHIRERRVVWANAAHDKMFGYSAGATIGTETSVFYSSVASFEKMGQDAYPMLAQGKTFSVETQMRKKDGSLFWCSLTGHLVDSEKPEQGSIWMVQDVSERKLAEQELLEAHNLLEARVRERTAELEAANHDLEKAARLKDEFLASMSHELRTPLSGILGLAEVMQLPGYGNLSEKQKTALNHIQTSGRHLLSMINEILDLAKIEAGKMTLIRSSFALEETCQFCLHAVSAHAESKHLQTSLSADPEGIRILADETRFKQILMNLLGNAVKFTPPGGRLGIEITGDRQTKRVHICVWDTGIGIKPEDLPNLFQTFVQLDGRLAREYGGLGLGLAMVRRLAELHGGSVEVQSQPSEGSRFTVILPWNE